MGSKPPTVHIDGKIVSPTPENSMLICMYKNYCETVEQIVLCVTWENDYASILMYNNILRIVFVVICLPTLLGDPPDMSVSRIRDCRKKKLPTRNASNVKRLLKDSPTE